MDRARAPGRLCLQEIKATPEQVPQPSANEGYWCYWHGGKGYSGVALHVRKAIAPEPRLPHPAFDYENRIVDRRIGRVDDLRRVGLRAERRKGLPGQDAVPRGDGRVRRAFQAGGRAACRSAAT